MNTNLPRQPHGGQLALPWLLSCLLLGVLALALQACRSTPEPAPAPPPPIPANPTSTMVAFVTPATPMLTVTAVSSPALLLEVTGTITASLAISPTATPCPPAPAGWEPYVVQAGDTLYDLSLRASVSQASVVAANCLTSTGLLAGQTIFLPPLPEPTATPCVASAPVGWQSYTVRAGDTLSALAATRGTSVDQIMSVNCLASTMIVVEQTLYVPASAVAIAPLPTPDQPGATGCVRFNCRQNSLPDLPIPAGGPNDVTFVPCKTVKGTPWISVETEASSNDLQHGQRTYYFACEFPDPTEIKAWMTYPGGITRTLDVLTYLPNRDLQIGQAQRVIPWHARCDLALGSYTLTVSDRAGNQKSLSFSLNSTNRQRILTVPQSGVPGTAFQVYYCGYQPQAGQLVMIDLYYEFESTASGDHNFRQAESWLIPINGEGWAAQLLPSSPGDSPGAYLLRDRDETLKGWDLIWLLR